VRWNNKLVGPEEPGTRNQEPGIKNGCAGESPQHLPDLTKGCSYYVKKFCIYIKVKVNLLLFLTNLALRHEKVW
jgi:hypothetical protein